MLNVDSQACWAASAVFNGAGFVAALVAIETVLSRNSRAYRRLLWLVPVILLSAWLESALNSDVARQVESIRLSGLYRHMGGDLIAWPVLALAFLGLRRVVSLGRRSGKPKATASSTTAPTIPTRAGGAVDGEMQNAVERFIAAVDGGDVASVTATYDPGFTCVRVADEGGFVRLTREQMLSFFNRSGGHAIPTKDTMIQHAEVIGDIGLILLTRVKDLGNGWEPMFYTLMWKKQDGAWRLLREFVHQRTAPRWR
jgi:hypothetical protein